MVRRRRPHGDALETATGEHYEIDPVNLCHQAAHDLSCRLFGISALPGCAFSKLRAKDPAQDADAPEELS